MAPIGLVTMSISSLNTNFKELRLIVAGDCVIFPKSLIGATMQDGGKKERKNVGFLLQSSHRPVVGKARFIDFLYLSYSFYRLYYYLHFFLSSYICFYLLTVKVEDNGFILFLFIFIYFSFLDLELEISM